MFVPLSVLLFQMRDLLDNAKEKALGNPAKIGGDLTNSPNGNKKRHILARPKRFDHCLATRSENSGRRRPGPRFVALYE